MVLLWFGFSKFANVTTWRLFVVVVSCCCSVLVLVLHVTVFIGFQSVYCEILKL